jgi:hypothetical protein
MQMGPVDILVLLLTHPHLFQGGITCNLRKLSERELEKLTRKLVQVRPIVRCSG